MSFYHCLQNSYFQPRRGEKKSGCRQATPLHAAIFLFTKIGYTLDRNLSGTTIQQTSFIGQPAN